MAGPRAARVFMRMGTEVERSVGEKVTANPPLVSVIIPAYNVAPFINETLDSVAGQIFRDFEVIVINDGSPDTEAFEKAIESHMSSLIYLKQTNAGVSSARNSGIRSARGTYLAFLDGDDVWFPEYLGSQIDFLTSNAFDFVYADALLFGANVRREKFTKNAPSRGAVSVKSLISGNCNVLTSGTVVRRDSVIEVGGFDEDLPRIGMEDFDLWIRLLRSGVSAGYQTKTLLKYRVRQSSLSGSNVDRAERSAIALSTIARKYELTAEERQVLESRLEDARKNVLLERAKKSLVTKDFEATRSFLDTAWSQKPGLKHRGITMLLSVFPDAIRFLFKLFRSEEYEFILKENEPTR